MSLDDYFITPEEYLQEFAVKSDPRKIFKQEKRRHINKRQQILRLLLDREWHSNAELKEITPRYGARLKELRDMGWIIEKEYRGKGLWEYRLIGRAKT